MWADDILLISEMEEGLQLMLNNLSLYARKNGMKIIADKTKSMIFNKSGKFFRNFKFDNENIFTTNSYKYLGFLVTPSGEINSGLRNLKDRALRAYFKLKNNMGHYFRVYPEVTLHLFNTLIKPILLYASDFWGCLKMPSNNPIENTHMRFCKDVLGVQRQSTHIGVLLELGRIPTMLYGKVNCIKNWGRIHIVSRANDIVILTHHISIRNRLKWTQALIDSLNNIGIGGDSRNELVHKTAMKRMSDIFHQEAFMEINRDRSKLRTYGKIKSKLGMEKYLLRILNVDFVYPTMT